MKRILQTYVIVILCIICTKPKVFLDNCNVLKSDGCSQCNTDSSTIQNTLCSLHVMVRTSRILDINRRDYFYRWFYNGTRKKNTITPDNNRFIDFSGKHDEKACNNTNSCVMEIHLQLNLPRPFSRFNYGNYTVRLRTTVEPEEEEVSCSTLVCARSIIGRLPDEKGENNNNEETNGVIIQYSHVYIITAAVVFCLVIIIVLMCAVLRLQKKASTTNRRALRNTQHQISEDVQDDQISVNEISTAVSNHTYASIQQSGLLRYQALLDRNPSSTHRYDEPTSEQTLGNESNDQHDDGQERREIRRPLSRNPGNTVNILASELRNALTREQTENVPDIIVHDYQNIRRTRRLT